MSDCISRQAVIDLIKTYNNSFASIFLCYRAGIDFAKCVNELPSVTPTVIDKIRAEIADLDDADYDYEGYYKAVTDAIKIIDKYKAESEDKE